jgi:hypothetical protein
MMGERLEKHKARLAAARARLEAALDQAANLGEVQIYSEGAQWTVRQLAIHLAIADKGHNSMVFHYAEGKEFIPADYDIERFNKRSVERQAEMTLEQARESLRQSRAEMLAWFETVSDESVLDKEGRHANLQIMPISRILDIMAGHEDLHTADIEKLAQQSAK